VAKPILEDQSLDYSKPFTVEFSYRDASGTKRTIVRETYPLKQSVEYRKRLGLYSPWDQEVR
jgi:hypothetical protein